jgi:GT2 family glycosyltransferase
MDVRVTVSIIVPHYNDLAGLDVCLTALLAQTYPLQDVELIVADNGSPQGLAAVEEVVSGRARLILVEDRGAGPARNAAVAVAKGEILAFTDSDCVPDSGWLAAGVAALARHDIVGGKVNVLVPDESRLTPSEAFERVFAFNFKSYIERKRFTGAGNMFCSSELFRRVGGFGSGLSEDYEWSKRAQSFGYRLGYAPEAVVGHPARRTWDELIRKWRRMNVEAYGLLEGRRWRRLRWFLRTMLLPVSMVVHTPKVLFSPKLKSWRERRVALQMLFALRTWRMMDALRLLFRAQATVVRPAGLTDRSDPQPPSG